MLGSYKKIGTLTLRCQFLRLSIEFEKQKHLSQRQQWQCDDMKLGLAQRQKGRFIQTGT